MITACIKSHGRWQLLERCIRSVERYLGDARILIHDDSDTAYDRPWLNHPGEYLDCVYDEGISKGRNAMLMRCHTPWALILDDDHELTDESYVENLRRACERNSTQLGGFQPSDHPGGKRDAFWGQFVVKDETLQLRRCQGEQLEHGEYYEVDCTPHPMLVNCEAARSVKWDEELKVAEHWDFFYRFIRAGYSCIHGPSHIVRHNVPPRTKAYLKMRQSRYPSFKRKALLKHGFKRMVLR